MQIRSFLAEIRHWLDTGRPSRNRQTEPVQSAHALAMLLPDNTRAWPDMARDASRPFYFIHIPKTAGTSLIAILDRLFHQTHIFPAQLWRELRPEIVQQASRFSFFRGHFGGGGLKVFSGSSPQLLTMLRDPLPLSVSTYHFIRREKNTRVHQLVKDLGMTLEAFAAHPRTRILLNDRQVRYLSFDIHDDPDAQDIFLSSTSEQVVRQWLPDKAPELTAEQRYQRALSTLKTCEWFGIQERFDDSLRLFAWQFGLPPVGVSERLNARRKASRVSEQARLSIERANSWDRRLYAWAVDEFERRFDRMKTALENVRQRKTDTIDDLLRHAYRQRVEQYLRRLPESALPDRWRYHFDQPLIGCHWHRRELALPEKHWFRWTGPQKTADLWLVLKPGRYQLSLEVINAISPADIEQLRLQANEVELSTRVQGDAGSVVRTIQAQLSARVFDGSAVLRLQIRVPRVQTHAEAFGSDDQRRVGVAVRSITIEPIE